MVWPSRHSTSSVFSGLWPGWIWLCRICSLICTTWAATGVFSITSRPNFFEDIQWASNSAPIEQFEGSKTSGLLGDLSVNKQEVGEQLIPVLLVFGGQLLEHGFESAIKPLHQAICLRVVGRCVTARVRQ